MASLISRRFSDKLFISCRSSSLNSQSLPSNTNTKPSPQLYLRLALTASTPSNTDQKPKILEPSFVRSAPFSTYRTPRKPTLPKANHFPSKPKNQGSQLPGHFSFIRETLKESMNNMVGLRHALAVQTVVHTSFGAWMAYILPFQPTSVLTQCFGASAIQLCMVILMRYYLRKMKSLKMETENDFLLIFTGVLFAGGTVVVGTLFLNMVYWGLSYWVLKTVLTIKSIEISTLTMMALPLPLLYLVQILRLKSDPRKPDRQRIRNLNWTERQQILELLNTFLLRLKKSSYCTVGLSSALLLNYGIVNYGSVIFSTL